MGMPWRPSDYTGNDFLQDACRIEKLSNAYIGVSEKPVHLLGGCKKQGVQRVWDTGIEEHVLREFERQPETRTWTVSAA
ncbi:hypothetical protein TNCV_3557341 [Trichonephila clavipes]|uniref:Uncharacterized protein n=1 Tax=Trichonephila clavipes TaxID=2585209 RepID=A0A8X6WDI6_TRICX|nr:hypothetical protein TNCV_3557341 [Trichonephila clavipes]